MHYHEVDWSKTKEPAGFYSCLRGDLKEVEAWQFSLGGDTRLFGFRLKDIFYAVWFDTQHRIYD
jgi:hypothetical protein